jgi:hypothetical protein
MLSEDLRLYEAKRDGKGLVDISSDSSTSSQLDEPMCLDPPEISPPPVEHIDDPLQVRCSHFL